MEGPCATPPQYRLAIIYTKNLNLFIDARLPKRWVLYGFWSSAWTYYEIGIWIQSKKMDGCEGLYYEILTHSRCRRDVLAMLMTFTWLVYKIINAKSNMCKIREVRIRWRSKINISKLSRRWCKGFHRRNLMSLK